MWLIRPELWKLKRDTDRKKHRIAYSNEYKTVVVFSSTANGPVIHCNKEEQRICWKSSTYIPKSIAAINMCC
jgi:hypothetical protein